jgi:hypothetical protein
MPSASPTSTFELAFRAAVAAACVLVSVAAWAHPARGIVVTPAGQTYFSDLERIWSIAPNGKLSLVREHRGVHTHSLALTRGGDLLGEDSEYDSGDGSYRESIWRISPDRRFAYVYGPTKELERGVGLMRDTHGCTYHSDQTGLNGRPLVYRKCPLRAVERLVGSAADDRAVRPVLVNDVAGAALASDGSFYFRQGGTVRRLSPDGRLVLIADGLEPENFGIALDDRRNLYVAEFGPRRVLRVSPNGTRATVATSSAPWGPTGVFFRNGALFVLEATEYQRGVEGRVRVRKIVGNSSRTLATVSIPLP